jgi:WD40 repeat protein/tRNA A-37 threonylcarbamoyl transferase component Bud32
VRLRIGIHLGEVVIEEHEAGKKPKDLYGVQLDICARVMSLAKADQVLMGRGVFDSARQVLKGEDLEWIGTLEWLNHGPYLLKGIEEPVEVCEVRETGQAGAPGPPTSSEKAQRQVRANEEPVLGWRPAVEQTVPNTSWVLEKKLGEGGFGEVWLGRHQTMKERRVFKFCFRADRVGSLKREMTLFRLIKERIGDHPNIVRLLDVYFEEPPFYVEEEYVAGQDLRTWCEGQGGVAKVPLAVKLEIVAEIADALQAAHDAGVNHRDVKPANILVSGQQGQSNSSPVVRSSSFLVKLTDFGIGQVVSEEALKGVTRAGFTQTIVADSSASHTGTQLYMAPELLAGKPASIRSDIYSLGVVLYQLLVGDFGQPVTADWAADMPDSLLREDLRHCLAGTPAERFPAAAELAQNLRDLPVRHAELAQWETERAERDRLRLEAAHRRRILVVSAGVVVLLLLLAGALGYGLRKAERARQIQQRYAYASDMKAAHVAVQQKDWGLAVHLLRRHLPKAGESDLRGLEWRYLWQEARGDELRTFGCSSMVDTVVLSPDGRLLAAVAHDGLTLVWEAASGKKVREFRGAALGSNIRKSAAYSPDGKWLALLGQIGVEIRNTVDWTVVQELKSAQGPFRFSPDGKHFVAGVTNGVALWEVGNWRSRVLTNLDAGFNNLAVSFDAGQVVAAGESGPVRYCDLRTSLTTILEGKQDVNAVEISPNGKWLAAIYFGGEARLWDLAALQLVLTFQASQGFSFGLAFSPDSKLLATGGNDQVIRLWQTGTTNIVAELKGHLNQVWSLEFSRDSQRLVSSSKDRTAKVWNPTPVPVKKTVLIPPTNEWPVGPLRDGSAFVTADYKARMTRFYSLPEGQLTNSFGWQDIDQLSNSNHNHLPANQAVVGVSTNCTVYLWHLPTGTLLRSVPLGDGQFYPRHISSDKRWLVGRFPTGKAALYNLRAATRVPLPPDSDLGGPLGFSPDGRWLACRTTTNYAIRMWDLAAGREMFTFKAHNWYVNTLEYSSDSKVLASASADNDAALWSVERGGLMLGLFWGHQAGVVELRFSLDGRTLLTGSHDFTMRWWSAATGQEMLRFSEVFWRVWNPREDLLLWQEKQGPIRITTLPTWWRSMRRRRGRKGRPSNAEQSHRGSSPSTRAAATGASERGRENVMFPRDAACPGECSGCLW